MKIETLTPQIVALYYGQQCNVIYNAQIIGQSIRKIDCDVIHWIEYGSIEILPHLRPLSSLTESEARELYEMVTGEKWKQIFEKQADECLPLWVFDDVEDLDIRGIDMVIGNPSAWIHLLSLGFDLFGLIDAGLAKEITN